MTSCYIVLQVEKLGGTWDYIENKVPVQVCTTIGAAYAFKGSLEREKRADVLYYEVQEVPFHCPEVKELEEKIESYEAQLEYTSDW